MTELDASVKAALEHAVPVRDTAVPDWDDVLRRAAAERAEQRSRGRWYALVALAAAVAGLALTTPLAGAIKDGVGDFSRWLRGDPGAPVTAEEQKAFEEANAKAYTSFPGSPQLRRLARAELDGTTYDLLGFRSEGSLCIRVVAAGEADGSTTTCAPVADLENDDAPVRVLLADWGVGRGEKTRRVGFDTIHSARAQVTAGIAADGVRTVELHDEQGEHEVEVVNNAFLYVASRPEVGQRVRVVRAELDDGRVVDVPFAVAPWGPGGFAPGSSGAGEPGGPTRVERTVGAGRIDWLERREERGEPFDPARFDRFPRPVRIDFGRVLAPDPGSSKRIAITVSSGPPGLMARRLSQSGPYVCAWTLSRGGAGGGCSPIDKLFPAGRPFSFGYSVVGGGDQFATFAGAASDDVARLRAFTATGNAIEVPLRDNAYLVEISLARFPVKLVAYDAEGQVIGIERTPQETGPATVVGEPILRLDATADGTTLELLAYRTREGGECSFMRATGRSRTNMSFCVPKEWRVAPLRLSPLPSPPVFLVGRVRDDIETITVRYADGDEQQLEPGPHGYVLRVVPAEHRRNGHEVVELVGLDAAGGVVARQNLRPPGG